MPNETPVEQAAEQQEEQVQAQGTEQETSTDDKPAEDKAEEGAEKKPEEPKAEDKEDEKKNHFQRRQERLLRERAEYKARAELLQQMLDKQQGGGQQTTKEGRPSRDQFESDEDYVDALTTWKVEQKLAGVKQELSQHQVQSKTQSEWVSKINQARTEYADYDAAMEDAQDIPIAPPVADAIQSSDFGADIAYYLAKNPEEALRINSLSPIAAAREIGRIESYVEYEKSQKAKKPAPVSKAPAPIKPVKSSSGTAGKSLEDMSPAEYIAYRNKQAATKRR